ncbi:hypothetical protein ACFXHA_12090 [Nocardia sp. NPDC059240]|uniref:hypothetical protein n=1 Tax=Nocardia sp. NPDC059240 TaxID=3346786 RepID=UPI0036B0296F
MTEEIAAALRGLASAFEHYPQRPVLQRCPHCGPPVRVAEVDLFWLSLKLGNTVGDISDVKAFLPLLFERLVTTDELDGGIVLGKLAQQDWLSWPPPERLAVDTVIDAIWLALLSEFPSRIGAFTDPADFLAAVATATVPVDGFLTVWDSTHGEAADRHLAEFVNGAPFSGRLAPEVRAWIGRKSLRNRLLRAYERHHEDPEWSDAFARAHDLASL